MKNEKENNRIVRPLGILLIAVGLLMAALTLVSMNVAAQAGPADSGAWNFIVLWGVPIAVFFVFMGIIFLVVFGSTKTDFGDNAKAAGVAFSIIFFIVAAGIGFVVFTAPAAVITPTDDGLAVFDALGLDTNATAIADMSGTNTYVWTVPYNTTADIIANVSGNITFSFTVSRTDELAITAYFDTEVAGIVEIDNEPIIGKTSGLTDATWTDPDGGTHNLDMQRVPITDEEISADVSVNITLNDEFFEQLWQDGETLSGFDIIVAGETFDVTVLMEAYA